MFPLDTIKTRMQLQGVTPAPAPRQAGVGPILALANALKAEGLRGLFRRAPVAERKGFFFLCNE